MVVDGGPRSARNGARQLVPYCFGLVTLRRDRITIAARTSPGSLPNECRLQILRTTRHLIIRSIHVDLCRLMQLEQLHQKYGRKCFR